MSTNETFEEIEDVQDKIIDEDEVESSTAPLIEHLAELRTRLIHSAVAFIVAMLLCFTVARRIFNFLADPLIEIMTAHGQDPQLIFTGLQQGFMTDIRISLFGGFLLAFPYIAYQMWLFVAPGLYNQEKQAFLPFLLASPVMFFTGAAFAYYVVLPLAFDFFLGFQQNIEATKGAARITFLGTINEYLSLTMKFVLAFGLCFQLPVLLTLMGKVGMVSAVGLGSVRKYAMVAILILAAVVTPPDVITQVILFTVVYGLYELSILLVKLVEKKRLAKLRADGILDEDEDLY